MSWEAGGALSPNFRARANLTLMVHMHFCTRFRSLNTSDFSPLVPVQNREKEKDAASSPSYDVSSHVPSCKAS